MSGRRFWAWAGLFSLAAGPAAAQGLEPYRRLADAPPLFWLIVAVVITGILGFAVWAIRGRHADPEERASTARYHALGLLVPAMTIFTLLLYVEVAARMQAEPPTERAWNWTPGESIEDPGGSGLEGEPHRGYEIYLAEGCTYCHTLYVRAHDIPTGWAVGASEADISEPGDFVHYPYTLLGTQRNGPDLSIVGRRIADMSYQIAHLREPRRFKPESIMPSYAYLDERDLQDLAAYLVSLGNPRDRLLAGRIAPPTAGAPDEVTALALVGERLFRDEGCVACHTADGSQNVGPTFRALYGEPVPLADGSTVIADAAYLRTSILSPEREIVKGFPAVMPPYDYFTDEELDAILTYIESLGERS